MRLLRQWTALRRERVLEPASIEIAGQPVGIRFKPNARARRLIVRLDRKGEAIIVTVPPRVSRAQALDFVRKSERWIEGRLAQRLDRVKFASGALLSLRGEPHEIRHEPFRRGLIRLSSIEKAIILPGDDAHLARRLTDWLKREAKRDLIAASERYAHLMDASYRRLSVRDQSSRWGSCSAAGSLSYSWRLILAPSFVLDYVAAHEVAHLKHMNHGVRFWRLVLTHCSEAHRARDWLKRQGASLHRYG